MWAELWQWLQVIGVLTTLAWAVAGLVLGVGPLPWPAYAAFMGLAVAALAGMMLPPD